MSLDNYESNRRIPGPSDRRGQVHKDLSRHLPPDGRGKVHRNQAGYLATSSDPEHKYESLRNGNDHIYQDPDYEHYVEIAS